MVERYPDAFEMAYTADDVERIARKGKIASLIGIEGGVAIENGLAAASAPSTRLGARYMTLDPHHDDGLGRRRTDTAQARRPDAPSASGWSRR